MVFKEKCPSNNLLSWRNSGLEDFDEECLDYEADDIDECHFSASFCKESTRQSDSEHTDVQTEDLNVSHQREMISPFSEDSCDNRRNEYISMGSFSSDTGRTFIDSASDETNSSSSEGERADSPLEISPEEEDRYLQSDDEVEQESMHESTCQIYCETDATVKDEQFLYHQEEEIINQYDCQNLFKGTVIKSNTNNILTITTFTNGNTRKRGPPKWQLRYSPKIKSTRLFLDEIGYCHGNSSCDESISSKTSDNDSQSQKETECVKSVRITDEDNIRYCHEVESSLANSLPNVNFKFKVPFLPPAKRPPTRPKKYEPIVFENSTQLTSTDIWQKRTITNDRCRGDQVPSRTMEDDVVSIGASMSGLEDITETNSEIIVGNPRENYLDSEKRNNVEQWIREADKSVMTDTNLPALLDINVPPQVNCVPEIWQASDFHETRIDFKNIPSGFSGLCYYHFFNPRGCQKKRCSLLHHFCTEKFINKWKDIDKVILLKMYKFMLNFRKAYQNCFEAFLKLFCMKNMQEELVDSIKDFYNLLGDDITRAVELVVFGVQTTGLTVLESVERILFMIGIYHYPKLADSLMEILAKTVDIKKHWPMIKKIVQTRKIMSPKLANQILTSVTAKYPIDKPLGLDIYNVLITEQRTDISQIDEQLLISFRVMVNYDNNANQNTQCLASTSPPRNCDTKPPPLMQDVPIQQVTIHGDSHSNYSMERNEASTPEKDKPISSFKRNVDFASGTVTALYDSGGSSTLSIEHVSQVPLGSCSTSPINSDASTSQIVPSVNANYYVPQKVTSKSMNTFSINSTYHCNPEVTLTPPRPIIGKTIYQDNFQLDRSLHHLLPRIVRHTVPLSEDDSIQLNEAIRNGDGALFLSLLENNKNEAVIENFICMIVVHLKSTKKGVTGLLELLKYIETINPEFATDLYIKVVFEVVVLNLLVEYEGRGQFGLSRDLILKFQDWDSLVSCKLLQVLGPRKFSHMRRYILLAKMLAHDKYFFNTYEILECEELHLLESVNLWPYCKHEEDLIYRNCVLDLCFKSAYKPAAVISAELYKRLFLGQIAEYDVKAGSACFNDNLKSLIEEAKSITLGSFMLDIGLYYKYMEKDVLRAFSVLRCPLVDLNTKLKLYELCCFRDIYKCFTGQETTITVRADFFDVEHSLILSYYFHKLSFLKYYEYTDVKIAIILPERHFSKMNFLKFLRSIKDTNLAVRGILRKDFGIETVCNDEYSTEILISKEAVLGYLREKM